MCSHREGSLTYHNSSYIFPAFKLRALSNLGTRLIVTPPTRSVPTSQAVKMCHLPICAPLIQTPPFTAKSFIVERGFSVLRTAMFLFSKICCCRVCLPFLLWYNVKPCPVPFHKITSHGPTNFNYVSLNCSLLWAIYTGCFF